MSNRRHLHYGSTMNWGNLYKQVVSDSDYLFAKRNNRSVDIMDWVNMPTLTFRGSEKLHGENMAVCYSDGELWVQGRKQVRTLLGDQNGMAAFVEQHRDAFMEIIDAVAATFSINATNFAIVLDGEWAGGNIQKGNAACSGTAKAFYLFDYFRVVSNSDEYSVTYPTTGISNTAENIYNLASFGTYEVTLDFNHPDQCTQTLTKLAETIEANSPIAKFFDREDNVGEGAVLYCISEPYKLKTKGKLHGGKPKQPRQPKSPADTARGAELAKLAADCTPAWRITQAITETDATERKHLGGIIKWLRADIVKECLPELQAADAVIADIAGYVAAEAKQYFFDSIKGC